MNAKGKNNIQVRVMGSDTDVYLDIAREMFEYIQAGNAAGKKTVFIVPVGPSVQYKMLAWMINTAKLNMKDTYFINMDEYLTDDDKYIPENHPLSFRGFMRREFHDLVNEKLRMPRENHIFPDPDDVGNIEKVIKELGGVDVCYGGVGINGHIAFNEPPEFEMSNEEFAKLGTRTLSISRETRVIYGANNCGGDLDIIPNRCVTVGMKELLESRCINMMALRLYSGPLFRKAIEGPITPKFPSSFLQIHPNVIFTVAPWVVSTDPIPYRAG